MFKQQIDALQVILDNVTLPNMNDILDDTIIKQKDEEEIMKNLVRTGHSSWQHVATFLKRVSRRLLPSFLFGSEHNWNVYYTRIDHLVSIRRYETLTLHQLLQHFRVKDCKWLRDDTHKVYCGRYEPRVFASVLFWLFNHFLLTLLRNNFYCTDGEWSRNSVLYYRREVWRVISDGTLRNLRQKQYKSIDKAEATKTLLSTSRKLGYSVLRLKPKSSGLRPIVNMATPVIFQSTIPLSFRGMSLANAMKPNLATPQKNANKSTSGSNIVGGVQSGSFVKKFAPINQALRGLFEVLKYEKVTS
jgi:telomerase reverse transcriptase